jgi:hypothetical protein
LDPSPDVAEFEPPLEAARTRAERLRLLAKFTAGDEKQMLLQANHEENDYHHHYQRDRITHRHRSG